MMSLAMARYVQTGTQRSNATDWAAGANQAWMNTVRKASSLVTHVTSGTPTISSWTLLAPGTWQITAGLKAAGTIGLRLDIVRGTFSYSNSVASASAPTTANNSACATITLEVNANASICLVWAFTAGTTIDSANGDCNFVSFLYLGAL